MTLTVPNLAPSPGADLPLLLVTPFFLLLVLIAAMPVSPAPFRRAWERYYPHVAVSLGLIVAIYYFMQVPGGAGSIARTGFDYLSFICLIGSLFVVAGGVHIKVKGEGTPFANVLFLAFAGLTANVIGTTGASMVFIRPWIRVNRRRISGYHVAFFIFVVSNVGGP